MATQTLSPVAERGRQKAIERLQKLVKRDAKRRQYEKVNQWLDMIQALETMDDIEGSVN